MALGADVVGGIPWIEAGAGRAGGARRLGLRAGRAAGPAGGDAHRRRARSGLRHHPDARRGDAPARAGGPWGGLPRPGRRALRRGPAGRAARPGPRGRAGPGQRPAHRVGRATGGAGAGPRGGGRPGPGRHRGRVLPVRPAQPARGGLPRRAPAGHALGTAAGDARRPGDDVGRAGARARRPTASARAARPTCSCTTPRGRSTCSPAMPRHASSSAPAASSPEQVPFPGKGTRLEVPFPGKGTSGQSWKTSISAPISIRRS